MAKNSPPLITNMDEIKQSLEDNLASDLVPGKIFKIKPYVFKGRPLRSYSELISPVNSYFCKKIITVQKLNWTKDDIWGAGTASWIITNEDSVDFDTVQKLWINNHLIQKFYSAEEKDLPDIVYLLNKKPLRLDISTTENIEYLMESGRDQLRGNQLYNGLLDIMVARNIMQNHIDGKMDFNSAVNHLLKMDIGVQLDGLSYLYKNCGVEFEHFEQVLEYGQKWEDAGLPQLRDAFKVCVGEIEPEEKKMWLEFSSNLLPDIKFVKTFKTDFMLKYGVKYVDQYVDWLVYTESGQGSVKHFIEPSDIDLLNVYSKP